MVATGLIVLARVIAIGELKVLATNPDGGLAVTPAQRSIVVVRVAWSMLREVYRAAQMFSAVTLIRKGQR